MLLPLKAFFKIFLLTALDMFGLISGKRPEDEEGT